MTNRIEYLENELTKTRARMANLKKAENIAAANRVMDRLLAELKTLGR